MTVPARRKLSDDEDVVRRVRRMWRSNDERRRAVSRLRGTPRRRADEDIDRAAGSDPKAESVTPLEELTTATSTLAIARRRASTEDELLQRGVVLPRGQGPVRASGLASRE